MWILIAFLISLVASVIMFLVGLFLLATKKKGQDGTTGQLKTPVDEVKDLWQYLGLVDDSPNLIRAVVAGRETTGPVIGYTANLASQGKKCDPKTGKVEPLGLGENPYADESIFAGFMRKTFGKRVYGFPLIRNVKPLSIDRVVKKDTASSGDSLANQLQANYVTRYGLYEEIQRPTLHEDVDTLDGVRFTVISNAVIHVIDARPAFTIYPDSFLQTISQIISGFVSTKVIGMEWETYKTKGENGKKFDDAELQELDKLLKPLGVEVDQFTVSDPELNQEIQATMEARRVAGEKAKARREEGNGEKDYRISVGEGDARVIERIAKAKAKRFEELVNLYVANGVLSKDAVDKANDMISAEFTADAIGKLQGTWAPGATGVLGFGVGGKK